MLCLSHVNKSGKQMAEIEETKEQMIKRYRAELGDHLKETYEVHCVLHGKFTTYEEARDVQLKLVVDAVYNNTEEKD